MDQPDHHEPRFEPIGPTLGRTKFGSKHEQSQLGSKTVEESDQISIFDAAKYFSGLHDEGRNHGSRSSPRVMAELASMARVSSVSSSVDNQSNYRARSFHATPTASSEASWNSQTGLLSNPPGSFGIKVHSFSPMSTGGNNTGGKNIGTSTRWQGFNPRWLNPCRKCPCSGKKSVQIEERADSKTPRMVDLRRSYSSNDSNSSSFYPTRVKSPHKSVQTTISLPVVPLPQVQDPKFGPSLVNNPRTIVPVPLSLGTSSTSTSTAGTGTGTHLAKASIAATGNGFTFPILEDEPISTKRMFFSVITTQNNQTEPNRDSLEVFQPKSHHQSPRSRRMSYEEDNVSDGSSDLFEIESFSTVTHSRQCDSSPKRVGTVCANMGRDSLDYSEGGYAYPPSEVSIDWSVTTAEGFDKCSLSNFSVSASEGGGGGRRNGSRLLSCRSEKAVSVGPGPVKWLVEGGPPVAARHVGGGPPPPPQVSCHGNGKTCVMVGRS